MVYIARLQQNDPLPDNIVFLLRKEDEAYRLLVKYDIRLIWGDLHLFLQFNKSKMRRCGGVKAPRCSAKAFRRIVCNIRLTTPTTRLY